MGPDENQVRLEPPAGREALTAAAGDAALRGCIALMREVVDAAEAVASEEPGGPCGAAVDRLLDGAGLLTPLRAPGAAAALRAAAAGAPATLYAAACAAYERVNEDLAATVRRGSAPTAEQLAPLQRAREGMRQWQPHLLLWSVDAPGGAVRVETRDRSDWASDASDVTLVTGAFAEVATGDLFIGPFFRQLRVRETAFSAESEAFVLKPDERRELHAEAVRRLAEENGWSGASHVGARWVRFDDGRFGDAPADSPPGEGAAAAALAALEAAASMGGDRRVRALAAVDAAGLLAPLLAPPAGLADGLRRAVERLPAARYASACAALRRASEAMRSARRWMRDPTEAEVEAFADAVDAVRLAQPFWLLWRVATPLGDVAVATRDVVCGAKARVTPPCAVDVRCAEASFVEPRAPAEPPDLPEMRERVHREAVRRLAEENGWPWHIAAAGRGWAR